MDPRKRQQKLERHAAKRKEKKRALVKKQQTGLGERLAAAARYPILHAWVMEDLWAQGMGSTLLSRELPDGSIAVAVFLLDRYCLGVKNALANIVSRSVYESTFERKMRSDFPTRNLSPACVRKLVEGALAYARDLGFSPHPDYHKAKLLFGEIDAGACTDEFEFGKNGKPLFIAGPHDTPERCRKIMEILANGRGPDEFPYLVPLE